MTIRPPPVRNASGLDSSAGRLRGKRTVNRWQIIGRLQTRRVPQLAVQGALQFISEALRHLPDDLLIHAPDRPWIQIHDIGNLLRHWYHKIADDVI